MSAGHPGQAIDVARLYRCVAIVVPCVGTAGNVFDPCRFMAEPSCVAVIASRFDIFGCPVQHDGSQPDGLAPTDARRFRGGGRHVFGRTLGRALKAVAVGVVGMGLAGRCAPSAIGGAVGLHVGVGANECRANVDSQARSLAVVFIAVQIGAT